MAAGAATITWVAKVNLTALHQFGSVQRGEIVDKFTFEFETEMIHVTTNRTDLPEDIKTFVIIAKMFFQALESRAFKDAGMLLVGYLIVFLYVILMIGRFDFVHQRFWLSFGGILGVIMGIIVSYGLCSVMGFFYSPAHTVIPFLMLGIGIDDMFVIVQCRSTLSPGEAAKPVVERLGATMSQAGVAITITSITDFIAFGIGASTVLPALRSFCMFASIGILVIFYFQTTWFAALLALDEYRTEAGRDGCLCCLVHKSQAGQQSKPSGPGFIAKLFTKLSPLLVKPATKAVVSLLTAALLGVALFGLSRLRMEFRPEWLMDPKSEVFAWYTAHKQYFSLDGERGVIYLRPTNYTENLARIEEMVLRLEEEPGLVRTIDAWPVQFKKFLLHSDPTFSWDKLNHTQFQSQLSHFLFSPSGAKYRIQFQWAGQLECGRPAPPVAVSTIDFSHVGFQSASEWVPAYDRMVSILSESGITRLNSTGLTGSSNICNADKPFFNLSRNTSQTYTTKMRSGKCEIGMHGQCDGETNQPLINWSVARSLQTVISLGLLYQYTMQ